MIPRYSRKEMAGIWEPENKYRTWLEVEMLVCEAQAEIGVIPNDAPARIRANANFDIARIEKIEQEVKHDVIAFLTNVAEHVGEESRYVHLGMTSSDMIDTALSIQLRQAADVILAGLDQLLEVLRKKSIEHRATVCMGRSHGIHAEPTTFGLKLAGHYAAFRRGKERMVRARDEISICAISGAVGTFATIDPRVQAYVAKKLGFQQEAISTQVIPRDRHAMFFAALAVIASSIENLVTEIRHLQRTEVREVEEYFSVGQKGSSAMPHKRNPVLSENLTGLTRLIRATVVPALENVALWHERDISHSSVERVIAPDATILTDFALHRLTGMIDKLVVYPDRMKQNVDSLKGLVFSQSVLIALAEKGLSREEAYKLVQGNAMESWERGVDFFSLLVKDSNITKHLPEAELKKIFDYGRFTARIGAVIDSALA